VIPPWNIWPRQQTIEQKAFIVAAVWQINETKDEERGEWTRLD